MIVLIVIFLFIIVSALGIYTYHYFDHLFSFLNINIKAKKKVLLIFSIILMLLGINLSNISSIIILHWFIIGLIVNLVFYIIDKFWHKDFKKVKYSGIIPVVLTTLILTYGYFNMQNIKEKVYVIETNKELKQDYTFLFLSDLHFKTTMDIGKLRKIVDDINHKNYDFAILGGDIIDEKTSKNDMIECFKVLGNIKTNYGIYYIYGNHDKQPFTNNKKFSSLELASSIRKNNISILVDDDVVINDDIVLFGRDDISINTNRLKAKEEIDKLDKKKFLLIADHEPTEVSSNAKLGFDLQVSGHTHAGQIFPAKQIIELFLGEVAYGHIKEDNYDLIVSSGIGGWGYPLRTSAHSEFVTVKIKNKS